jgi:hypothetical protein
MATYQDVTTARRGLLRRTKVGHAYGVFCPHAVTHLSSDPLRLVRGEKHASSGGIFQIGTVPASTHHTEAGVARRSQE